MAGRPDFKVTMGLVGASTIATGIDSVINIVGKLTAVIKENAENVQQYSRVIDGHNVSVVAADEATSSLIDTIEIHRQAARAEQAGLELTEQQYRALAVAAGNYAQRTGQDITESFEHLTNAVITASDEGLRLYGIELQGLTSRSARQESTIEQLTERFGEQTVEIQSTYEAIQQLENTWGTAWSEMLLAVERNAGPIRTIITGITGTIQELINAMETQRRAQRRLAQMGNETRMHEIQGEITELGYNPWTGERYHAQGVGEAIGLGLSRTYQGARGLIGELVQGDVRGALQAGFAGEAHASDRVRRLMLEHSQLQARDVQQIRTGQQQPRPPERTVTTPLPPRRPGGGGLSPAEQQRRRDLAKMAAMEEREAERVEAAREKLLRQEEIFNERRQEMHAEQLRMLEERTNAEVEGERRHLEMAERRAQLEEHLMDQAAERMEKEQNLRQDNLDSIAMGYELTASVMGGFVGVATELSRENEKATRVVAIAEGALLVGFNTAKAVTETALAISDQVNRGRHIAAAVAHWSAVAVSAAQLGVTASKSSSGGGGGGHRPEHRGSRSGGSGGGGNTIIMNVNGPVTSRRVHDDLRQMERDSGRRSYP